MKPLLDRLDPNDKDMLLINCKRLDVKKGEHIFKEGNPSRRIYFIHKGSVRIFKKMGHQKEITIFLRGSRDAFGEIGIFSGDKYSNTAQATKDCILYYLEKKEAEIIIGQNGRLGLELTKWVAESLEASKAKIRDYIAFGSEGAIASIFIRYSNMYGIVVPEGIMIDEPIRLQDISKHIGISRETVSRIVNEWKRDGIIENNNKHFLIKDINYLKEMLMCEDCGVQNCIL